MEPDPGHTRLRLSREGLEAIQRINSPIAAVAVSWLYSPSKLKCIHLFQSSLILIRLYAHIAVLVENPFHLLLDFYLV